MAKDSVQAIVHVVPECEDFAAHMKKHAPAVVVGITEDGEIVSPETLRGVRPS